HYREALEAARDGDDPTQVGLMLMGVASLAAARGQPARAVRLASAAAAWREVFGAPFAPAWAAWYARWLDPAHRALGETARAEAWAEGQTMTLQRAVAVALDEYDGG